jgi:hypothetical protein
MPIENCRKNQRLRVARAERSCSPSAGRSPKKADSERQSWKQRKGVPTTFMLLRAYRLLVSLSLPEPADFQHCLLGSRLA